MKHLVLSRNKLSDGILDVFGAFTSLILVEMSYNSLTGPLPSDFGNLKNLVILFVSKNKLSGEISKTLGECPGLMSLDMAGNFFKSNIPLSFGSLKSLETLNLSHNNLPGTIPHELEKLPFLSSLNLSFNHLEEMFDISLDGISGSVPNDLGNLKNLQQLKIGGNYFGNGKIRDLDFHPSLSNCSLLKNLALGGNQLGGLLPESIGYLSIQLNKLSMEWNLISGNIQNGIGNLVNLKLLDMRRNALTDTLPTSIGMLQNLERFFFGWNNFSGEIPFFIDFGNLKNLIGLFVHENKLSGEIPKTLGECSGLTSLDMAGNFFQGNISYELEELPYLSSLNLFFNHLEGEVPKRGIFNKSSGFSVVGNKNLCGGIPAIKLPKCLDQEPRKKGTALSAKAMIVMILGILVASILVVFLFVRCCRQRFGKKLIPAALFGDGCLRVSYKELLQATGGFASSNLIGVGSFGSVYKGFLHQQEKLVAVKIINWLHGQHKSRYLNFVQRLDIDIDVANAIDYLHHNCEAVIVHCDLKPSNVLLDDDMVAHVSDFGLAKILSNDADNMGNDQASSSMMKGTIGYVSPEYGMGGAVSPEGDIYSYGILLLEMITGRRPTDGMFHGDLSLHNFCKMALPEQLKEIIDFHLLEQISENNERPRSQPNMEGEMLESLVSFTKIGVACSAEAPGEEWESKMLSHNYLQSRQGCFGLGSIQGTGDRQQQLVIQKQTFTQCFVSIIDI
ncbi:Protein kinase domain - like 10 [Theobroma cacao]|nr:Protein kinase domain - like 10 [Theobroma cacao]